jgi:hypothetical protein
MENEAQGGEHMILETNYSTRAYGEYFRTIIGSRSYLVEADRNYLKKIRRHSISHIIDRFLYMDDEEREKIMEILTDIVSGKTKLDDYEKVDKKIEESAFGQKLVLLQNIFENLTNEQKYEILKDAVTRTKAHLEIIYKIIKDDLNEIAEEHLDKVIIAKQIIYACINLIDQVETAFTAKDLEDISKKSDRLSLISILLLRLEAARRGKIEFKELNHDLYIVSDFIEKKLVEEKIGSIYDIIGLYA